MKITDVTLTLFAWGDIPPTTYGRHTGRFSGASQLGLLAHQTDDGVEGHAFLGSAMRGAHLDGESLIQKLKPLVMGQDPLDRERLYQALWSRSRQTTLRAIGAVDVALWDLAGKVANLPIHRLLGSYRIERAGLRELRGAAVEGGVRRGGAALQGRGLDRVQDPPADRSRRGHRGVPRRAPGRRRRLPRDARLDVGVPVPGGAARRQGRARTSASTGTRTRWPTTTSTAT